MLHKAERRAASTKALRETEAEAVAFVVGKAIGLEVGTASADYIHLYDGDAALLAESLEAIQGLFGHPLSIEAAQIRGGSQRARRIGSRRLACSLCYARGGRKVVCSLFNVCSLNSYENIVMGTLLMSQLIDLFRCSVCHYKKAHWS
jgi:hypothetical protein